MAAPGHPDWFPPYRDRGVTGANLLARARARGGGGGGSSGEDKRSEGSTLDSSKALGPSPSDILSPTDVSEADDESDPKYDFFQTLDRMEAGEEKYPKRKPGKSKHTLRLKRARMVQSILASIENVCKISSSVLVNKLECKDIADHFKAIANVFKRMGLGEDFVSSQALKGSGGIQTNFTFDKARFSHILKTFEDHFHIDRNTYFYDHGSEDFKRGSHIQDTLSIFEDYICELPAMDVVDGSSEESLSKHFKINEGFQDYILEGMFMKDNAKIRSWDYEQCRQQRRLDEFLCLLLGILKKGEDLVLFHSGLEGDDIAIVEQIGLHVEKFIQIHKLLNKLFKYYASLARSEGTEFVQSLLYYLNSNCLGWYESLDIHEDYLKMERATTISEQLERPNCILKSLNIKSSGFKVDQEEIRKCRLMVIAALSKCVSVISLTIHGRNGTEIYELCKSLSINKVLQNLVILIDESLADDNAMDLSTMLKENHSLKSFTLKSRNISPKGAASFGVMMAENSSLEELNLQFQILGKIGMRDLMRPLMANVDGEPQVNFSLKQLHINFNYIYLLEETEIIAQLLRSNKTLTHFSINCLNLDLEDTACEILGSLIKNKTLQVLDLQGWSSFKNNHEVGACLERMLIENSTLEELKVDMYMWDKFCVKHLLRPMANEDGESHVNNSLKRLHILNYNCDRNQEAIESIAKMLGTNETLTHFSIINASLNTSLNTSDVCKILDSLKKNKALEILNLDKCVVLDDPWVKVAFMDLLVNYNFTLNTIMMHGKDWDIEAFIKFELELSAKMAEERLKSHVGGISRFSTTSSTYDMKQVLEDFQLEKSEEPMIQKHRSFVKAFEDHEEEVLVGCLQKPKEIFGLKYKREMESEKSVQELKPLLESISKSTNFLLWRNLNMTQLLQKRCIEWNSFAGMYPSKLTNEEKKEISKGCITAALFPTTFLCHLKAHFLEGPNVGGMLKKAAHLFVERMKSLYEFESQTFQFIDYVDIQAPFEVQHTYSSTETIAICQSFPTRTRIGEVLPVENSMQYGIVQDHLTGAYYFESGKSLNLDKPNIDKPTGVIGVKVTSTEIQVEIMWEDGSYFSGPLEDFSYNNERDDNKQCALKAFGDLKGADFLKTGGLKCSPLLIIALAMAIRRKGLTLTWSSSKGHIQINSLLCLVQPTEWEVWEAQIIFGGDINQLGDAVEWGMHESNPNGASSSGGDQGQGTSQHDSCQIFSDLEGKSLDSWSSDESHDISDHTFNNEEWDAWVAQMSAGAQDKRKMGGGVKILGLGVDISDEIKNCKGKKIFNQAYEKIQDLLWKKEGGFAIVKNLNDVHQLLVESLFQGSLCNLDINYLVVYDDHKESHVSLYCAMERYRGARLELKWITDIFIKGGLERIKKIFKGLKGETLEVRRRSDKFHENPLPPQSKGFMEWFKNWHLSKNGSCKDNALQMIRDLKDPHPKISKDEWKHIVGPQPDESKKFWLMASYMKAITFSRTIYSSGILLSTYSFEKDGLKWGRARRESRCDALKYVHDTPDVQSRAKFSKAPESLSIKCHQDIYWGGF